MSVNDKIRAGNGIINWLNNHDDEIDIGKAKTKSYRQQEIHLNNLLLEFGKFKGLKLIKNNSRKYRGTFSPFMENAYEVQNYFGEFIKWLKENYSKN